MYKYIHKRYVRISLIQLRIAQTTLTNISEELVLPVHEILPTSRLHHPSQPLPTLHDLSSWFPLLMSPEIVQEENNSNMGSSRLRC